MPKLPKSKRPYWQPERKAHERRKNANYDLYNSKRWRALATWHKMNNPLCSMCLDKGISTPAQVTDHITPINQGGAIYDTNNMQSLCHDCHNSKSGKEAHAGRGGAKR